MSLKQLSKIQESILDILMEYDKICRTNSIVYSLHGGSLLGAIREKGFIPWDDDADVVMLRSEYMKLSKCFNQQSHKFTLIETYLQMPRIIYRDYTSHEFCWLDIMIYDPIHQVKLLGDFKVGVELLFQALCRDSNTIKLCRGKGHKKWQTILFYTIYTIGRLFPYESKYHMYNSFSSSCINGNGALLHRSNDQLRGLKLRIPVKFFRSYIDMPFENLRLMVNVDYEEILISSYGKDYMTPIRDEYNDNMHILFRDAFIHHLGGKTESEQ